MLVKHLHWGESVLINLKGLQLMQIIQIQPPPPLTLSENLSPVVSC